MGLPDPLMATLLIHGYIISYYTYRTYFSAENLMKHMILLFMTAGTIS